MPVCPQCDNRPFSNKEALLQHMKSSSSWHPFCSICDRRFVSETAYDAHMAAKHPPTYDCTMCNRSYHAPFALEDHYRGSPAHPNCGRCGRGFLDAAACEEHHRTSHPKAPCLPCGGKVFYDDALDQHFWDSQNHPSCIPCNTGFKDDAAYAEHVSEIHPELRCGICSRQFETVDAVQAHFLVSPAHPRCNECNLGFQDLAAYSSHEAAHAPPPSQTVEQIDVQTSVTPIVQLEPQTDPLPAMQPFKAQQLDSTLYSTGFTPLSPRNRIQDLIVGERRINSPDLRLETNFGSPIKDVQPLFSPTSLPRPGGIIEELWSSRENVQIPAARNLPQATEKALRVPISRSPIWTTPPAAPPPQVPNQGFTMNRGRPSPGPIARSFPETMPRLHTFSPPFSPPAALYHEGSTGSLYSPPKPSFDSSRSLDTSRFSARRETRHISPPHVSPPRADFHPRLYPGSVRHAARTTFRRQSPPRATSVFGSSEYGVSSGNNPFTSGSHSLAGFSEAGGHYSHHSIGRSSGGSVSELNWRDLMGNDQEADLRNVQDLTFSASEISTPTVETPIEMTQLQSNHFHSHNIDASPSLATVSSPASSALGHSPVSNLHETDTRPTTASSNHTPPFQGLAYTITPSSECESPQSPSVASPVGLEILPGISPLISTPVDLAIFDIPEARKPLPASPEPLSPVTVVLDIKSRELSAPVPSISPMSTSSSQSFITSPQEPLEEATSFAQPPIVETLAVSPTTPVAASPKPNPHPLHCRVCLADSCDDITASMCGHVFCNRCITDVVIKTSRCPVCMTPTLLYCLFRLDLAA
ncbi:hypothetical protein B0H34DRAFT_750660 [Crassisporium funariophilum]|nr:hypothetical protein B0H34DRAFT_750660 [Crassisporium funariophilum]